MLSTRDIKRKIRTVQNIQQICRAMKTVSSIKLRKAEGRIIAARPYATAMREVVAHLGSTNSSHPLLNVREVRRAAVVALSADKGLAGSYNTTIIRDAINLVRSYANVCVVPVGRKITETFRRQGFEILAAIPLLGATPEFRTIAALADQIGDEYASGALDRVDLIYTEYGGRVTTQQLLPIQPPVGEETISNFIFEPDPGVILERLLPVYLRTMLFTAVLSSVAAEHSARVAAMSLATENADELIGKFTLEYNKSRQAAITSELVNLVGAAAALL